MQMYANVSFSENRVPKKIPILYSHIKLYYITLITTHFPPVNWLKNHITSPWNLSSEPIPRCSASIFRAMGDLHLFRFPYMGIEKPSLPP